MNRNNKSNIRPSSALWDVVKLVNLIKKKRIINPQCQRKKKWTKFPVTKKTKTTPNYKYYIDFLYKTRHTIGTISLARYIDEHREEYYINIDGNNRMNAIVYFHDHPLEIYHENFAEVRSGEKKSDLFIHFLQTIPYPTFMDIRRMSKYILNDSKNEEVIAYWNQLSNDTREYIENELENTQTQLKIDGDSLFHLSVNINLVIFDNPSEEEFSKIFLDMNIYHNPVLPMDSLAATLLRATGFNLDFDPVLNTALYEHLKKHYYEKCDDEILEGHTESVKMNGHEFLISFQDYCNEKYGGLVPNFGGEQNVFHKLFTTMFDGLDAGKFNTENVKTFITDVNHALSELTHICKQICPENISIGSFKKDAVKYTIHKNALIIIVYNIIIHRGLIECGEMSIQKSHSILKKVIAYHFLVDYLPDTEERDIYKIDDYLKNEPGGNFVSSKIAIYKKNPEEFGRKITDERFKEMLCKIVASFNRPTLFGEKAKRRSVSYPYRLLYSIYYNTKVPFHYTQRKQNIDHVFPFSSKWEETKQIDLDRIGNLILMDEDANRERSNKSISYYYQQYRDLMNCLNYPSVEVYNKVVHYKDKTNTFIVDPDLYNEVTGALEQTYIDCAVRFIYG